MIPLTVKIRNTTDTAYASLVNERINTARILIINENPVNNPLSLSDLNFESITFVIPTVIMEIKINQ